VTNRVARVVALVAACFIVTSCKQFNISGPIHECTLIGCTSGVTVTLSGTPMESYRVEIIEAGSSIANKVQICSAGAECSTTVHFDNYQPQGNVRIRVVTSRGTATSPPILLRYNPVTPNGPDCSPTCLIANVTMPLPA
jgi:hypothetical protein